MDVVRHAGGAGRDGRSRTEHQLELDLAAAVPGQDRQVVPISTCQVSPDPTGRQSLRFRISSRAACSSPMLIQSPERVCTRQSAAIPRQWLLAHWRKQERQACW